MSSFITTCLEWVCTLLSIYGSWLCIRKRVSGFVVVLAADLGWFVSAWMNDHPSLLVQQFVYVILNLVGYAMWRQDERLRGRPQPFQAKWDFDSFPRNRRYADLFVYRAAP
jgi:nicotinamide riboside transporter PnuC